MDPPTIHKEVLQKPDWGSQPDWGSDEEMRVTKRNGSLETVSFDKILQRFRRVGKEAALSTSINYTAIAMKVIDQLYDKISSSKIDELCAEQCASLASTHPDYTALAGRIVVSSHHKNTDAEFSKVMQTLYEFQNFRGENSPMISPELYKWSQLFARELEEMIDYSRDYLIDYFGFKTLERAYLMRLGGKQIVERPQHMWMRVAVAIHGSTCINQTVNRSREWKFETPEEIQEYADALRSQIPDFDEVLRRIRETYDGMSPKQFIHATPTLFNAGTPRPQLSSCFLVAMESDSIDGIYNTLKECATISKWAGGIGLHIHNIRASGSYIEGTGGSSNGIVPMLRVFNHTAKYVDQCVHPDTQIIVKNPDTNEFEYRAIQDIQAGDQIHNLPLDDPAGFSQAQFLQTNDTTGPVQGPVQGPDQNTNNLMNGPVHPGTNDPVSLLQINGDSYRNNTDVIKQVVKNAYSGEMICIRTAVPAYFLRVTPEHPVLVVRNKMRLDPNDVNGSTARRGQLEWISARDVTPGTSLLIQSNTFLNADKVTSEWYEGDVYDLEMTTYPNYMTTYGLVHNGGGKRNGSFAIYLEPWHADVELFLQMRKNHGDEELKARDLFYALWIPDLFMERMQQGGDWTLMCPNECPGLAETYGEEFKTLYESYEHTGKGRKTMKARDLWLQILDAQMETGTPYLCYKDSANRKSNQKNVGTIKSSNLCVAGSTLVLTDRGHLPIETMVGEQVNVWNGEEWSEVTICKTGENQSMVEVCTDDGSTLICTPYHKFYIQNPDGYVYVIEKNAMELCPGDVLVTCKFPIVDSIGVRDIVNSILTQYGRHVGDEFLVEFVDASVVNTHQELKYALQLCGVNALYRDGATVLTMDDIEILKGIKPPQSAKEKTIRIREIKELDTRMDTYCFTEPKRHMGVFNGILTGQCSEIVEYSDEHETAVCNLASIALPAFFRTGGTYDFDALYRVAKTVTYNLNQVIDINYYPTEKTRVSNMRHRPIGIGVQGLADVFILMGYAFSSDEARELNRRIFETIYYAAVEQSMELARVHGPYASFQGSPASQGQLQFDMWNVDPTNSRHDWTALKAKVVKHGLRNSLLLAPMPTASTSQILGYNECVEPITSNIFSRRTLAGEFILCNKYLMRDLMALGLWNEKIKNNIIANNGSIQQLDVIPIEIREKYKTVWELSMKTLIDMAADRGAFIDQSQSLNLWIEDPNYSRLTSMHVYAWTKGLKTGIYYLRRRAKHQAQKFTIEPEKTKTSTNLGEDDHEICEFCSS